MHLHEEKSLTVSMKGKKFPKENALKNDNNSRTSIWSVVGLANLLQRISTIKLFLARRYGTWKGLGTGFRSPKHDKLSNSEKKDAKKAKRIDTRFVSIKTLMDEKMSLAQPFAVHQKGPHLGVRPLTLKQLFKINEKDLYLEGADSEKKALLELHGSQAPKKIAVLQPHMSSSKISSCSTNPNFSTPANKLWRRQINSNILSCICTEEVRRSLRHAFGMDRLERYIIYLYNFPQGIPYGTHYSCYKSATVSLGNKAKRSCITRQSTTSKITDERMQLIGCKNRRKPDVASPDVCKSRTLRHKTKSQMKANKHHNEMATNKDQCEEVSGPTVIFPSLQGDGSVSPAIGLEKEMDRTMSQKEVAIDHSITECGSQESDASHLICQLQTVDHGLSNLDVEGQQQFAQIEDNTKEAHPEVIIGKFESRGSPRDSEVASQTSKEQLSMSLSRNLGIQQTEFAQNLIEKPNLPSPVSVLEPFFPGSVGNTKTSKQAPLITLSEENSLHEGDKAEVGLTSQKFGGNQTNWVERNAEYESTSSNPSSNLHSDRRILLKQFLDPSLSCESDFSLSKLLDDPMLLLDCIEEVVDEIQERDFSSTPWTSIISPNIRVVPKSKDFLQQVWEGIYRHIQLTYARTLDQLIENDINRMNWTDLQFDVENISRILVEGILNDLVEETVMSYGFEL